MVDGNGGSLAATQGFGLTAVNDAPVLIPGPESFAGDGKVITDIAGNSGDSGRAIAVQPDGKVLVTGRTGIDAVVVRYNTDGSLDTTFGGGTGKLLSGFGASSESVQTIALMPDGKFLLAGIAAGDFLVARYNADGSIDTSFGGGDGIVTAGIAAGSSDRSTSLVLTANGGFVVAGLSTFATDTDISVARFNADGSLDTSFAGDGTVTTDFGSPTDLGGPVAVQTDGKIVVGGITLTGSIASMAIARYNVDGSLDAGFGTGGKVTASLYPGYDSRLDDLIIQPDGKIIVVGYANDGVSNTKIALLRYNADGSLDSSFGGGDGIVLTGFGSDFGTGNGIALQADGKIVITAFVTSETDSSYAYGVARYNVDGSLDTTFGGGDGKVVVEPRSLGYEVVRDVTVLPDGRIVVVGESVDVSPGGAGSYDFGLVRLNSDGTLDTSTASVHEDAAAPTLTASGSFGFDDVDLSDTHTVSTAAATGNTLGGSLAANVITPAAGAAVGQVDWTYNPGQQRHAAACTRPAGERVVCRDGGRRPRRHREQVDPRGCFRRQRWCHHRQPGYYCRGNGGRGRRQHTVAVRLRRRRAARSRSAMST